MNRQNPRRAVANHMWILHVALLVVVIALTSDVRGQDVSDAANGSTLPWFRIRAVDSATGRGVPMVRFTMAAQSIDYYTDSAGTIAFLEPGLVGQDVYFQVEGHGYEVPRNELGEHAVILQVKAGETAAVKVRRQYPAERLYRMTGLSPYRDSRLLGDPVPFNRPPLINGVMGQDSVYVEQYHGKLFWLWGDTLNPLHPRFDAHYEVTAATTPLPGPHTFNPAVGVPLQYFTTKDGSLRKMVAPKDGATLTWFDGLVNLTDAGGQEHLFAHYFQSRQTLDAASVPDEMRNHHLTMWFPDNAIVDRVAIARLKELGDDAVREYQATMGAATKRYIRISRGLMEFRDDDGYFHKVVEFPFREADELHIGAQPLRARDGDTEYVYFPGLFPNRRVQADVGAIRDIDRYESFTCLKAGERFRNEAAQLDRSADGKLNWGWKRRTSPIGPEQQKKLHQAGHIRPEERWIVFRDVADEREITVQHNSIRWNPYRRRYVALFSEETPKLSETWYAEADLPTGPWAYMQKVVSHTNITFYNPCHHFSEEDGRVILFEGTVTLWDGFGTTTRPSLQHYDYNQIMYRLDLDHPQVVLPVPVYQVGEAVRYATRNDIDADPVPSRVPAFFAPDRQREGTVAVYQTVENGSPQLSTQGSGSPVFYAEPPDAEQHSPWTVPLYEFRSSNGRRICSVDEDFGPGHRRTERPVCYVWSRPSEVSP